MLCHKSAGQTASSAIKGGILCITRKETNLKHKCHVSLYTINRNCVHDDMIIEGQTLSGLCNYARKYVLMEKLCVSVSFDRKISVSSRCLSVKVDPKKNYYHILGVTPHCSNTKIKQAYYRLSKVYHPDFNKTKAAVLRFHELTEAYEVLSNPALKHFYDSGRHGKLHGVHRGVANFHPVNFTGKGPHQVRRDDRHHFDQRMKSHYSKTLKRFQLDVKKHAEEEKLRETLYTGKGLNFESVGTVLVLVIIVGIAYYVYSDFKK